MVREKASRAGVMALIALGAGVYLDGRPAGGLERPLSAISRRRVIETDPGFSGGSFAELSRFLYAGDASRARQLRKLNPSWKGGQVPARRKLRYPAPLVRVQRGQSLQRLGALWAGGSARSYLALLPLNPGIAPDPDRVVRGSWVVVPRLPTDDERARWRARFLAANPPAGETRVPETSPGPSPASAFLPSDAQERAALAEWYLERLDPKRDRERAEKIVAELLRTAPRGWKPHYLAGKFYAETGRPGRAGASFREALADKDAPIQVALLYVRALERAGSAPGPAERRRLLRRFPALEGLLAAQAPRKAAVEHP